MNPAILIVIAVVAVLAVTWATVRYARLISNDGYGHRPTPPTHHDQSILGR